jgi:hypothetical protein
MKAFTCLIAILLVGCTINYTDERPREERRNEPPRTEREPVRYDEPADQQPVEPVREDPPRHVETPHDKPKDPPRQVETPHDKPRDPPRHVETPHDKPRDPPKHVETPDDKPVRENPPRHVDKPKEEPHHDPIGEDPPDKLLRTPTAYRVAADPEFKWTGFMASIWYPDLDDCGDALIRAGAIGDRIGAMNLQNAIKAEFKSKSNWPADDIEDAGLTAMVYYSVTPDRPVPPRVAPIVIQTVNEKRVKVKVDDKFTQSYVSTAGWQSVFAESGMEIEVVNKRTEKRVQYPEFRTRRELLGYHVNLVIEVYYLTGEGRRKQVGAPAMTGMAYFYSPSAVQDDELKQTATTLVQRMHGDTWKQSSKPRADENKLKVAYRVAADSEFKWNGFMASMWYPDYNSVGEELADLGAISDRIIAMNLQRTAQDQFKSNSHWRADDIEDAGLMAMIYFTVEQNAPAPPRIVPVEVTVIEEERVEYKANKSFESSNVSRAGWERMFQEAGVKVTAEKKTTTTEKREEVIYTCDEKQPQGLHVSIAVEVYYLTGEGKRKKAGKSAQLGMAYWFTEKYPSDGKLSEVTKELITRMGKEGRK